MSAINLMGLCKFLSPNVTKLGDVRGKYVEAAYLTNELARNSTAVRNALKAAIIALPSVQVSGCGCSFLPTELWLWRSAMQWMRTESPPQALREQHKPPLLSSRAYCGCVMP